MSNRTIVFTLFDGDNEGVFNITLDLIPVDDHSTEVSILSFIHSVTVLVFVKDMILSSFHSLNFHIQIILIMNNVNISELDASDQYLLGNLTVFELMDEDTNE